ncbi:cation diffusion facilitator family transporter [bacterium]|nr:cation diffusion facilitator family transporter [bacterium]
MSRPEIKEFTHHTKDVMSNWRLILGVLRDKLSRHFSRTCGSIAAMHDHHHGHEGHSHSHDRGAAHDSPFGAMIFILVISGLFMVAEIVGGLWSGSLALLADSGHMAIDTVAVGLGLFASWLSRRPPNAQKTYGYYRAEILGATLNGALLMVGSLWIFYEAWGRLQNPQPIEGGWMTVIAIGGLIVNLAGIGLLHRHDADNINIRAVTLHLIFDALGSVGAIAAGVMVWKWGILWADPAVSILISCLILQNTFRLLSECVDILLEAAPKGMNVEVLREDLKTVATVRDVHDLHVWTLASGVIALSAHICIREGADAAQVLRDSNQLLHDKHGIDHATLQLEPESFSHDDDAHLHCQKP